MDDIASLFVHSVIAEEKLTKYLLNPASVDERSKAKFFASVGFLQQDPNLLSAALRKHPTTARLVKQKQTEFGRKFTFVCNIETPAGDPVCIKSIRQIDYGKTNPILIAAYPAG